VARDYDPEPCSIGIDVIIDYLEQRRRPRMAEYLRSLMTSEQRHAADRLNWEQDRAWLVKRLHQYEPPTPRVPPPDHTPPAEASD